MPLSQPLKSSMVTPPLAWARSVVVKFRNNFRWKKLSWWDGAVFECPVSSRVEPWVTN